MKTEAEHLEVLRQYMQDRRSVSHTDVRLAVVFFRNKKRPEFVPERIWQIMLSWG